MDFKTAVETLTGIYGASSVAEALGVAPQTARAMRSDPASAGYRRPPADWRRRLEPLAKDAALRFAGLRDELSSPPDSPNDS